MEGDSSVENEMNANPSSMAAINCRPNKHSPILRVVVHLGEMKLTPSSLSVQAIAETLYSNLRQTWTDVEG
jgi:hypothetical protein